MATIRERLDELYRRLALTPRAPNAEDALEAVCRTLEEVEDELSGIPKQVPAPPIGMSDGRMYRPEDDSIVRLPNGRIEADARRHVIECDADGGVVIRRRSTGNVEFSK